VATYSAVAAPGKCRTARGWFTARDVVQPDESAKLASVREAIVSCAAAEGLLRGMLVRLDFSADELFARHLNDFEDTLDAVVAAGIRHASVAHLEAARSALQAASTAFDPWRYSSDPEHSHLPLFQSESLRLLAIAQAEREAAAAQLS
jgi:hypothetical protein